LAREFGPQGIHVGHVVVDGGIDGYRLKTRAPDFAARMGEGGLIGLDGIAESYRFLYRQPRNAWTQELDLRTHKEQY
ncbi:MAG: short-chain dehydrogenase, partial [Rhodospirillales bacterium]|nr:short-chain dehydrogenase [Rhodospirillales bacterium]